MKIIIKKKNILMICLIIIIEKEILIIRLVCVLDNNLDIPTS